MKDTTAKILLFIIIGLNGDLIFTIALLNRVEGSNITNDIDIKEYL